MAYKMKGSPAKLGTIQGTSGHSSALKQYKKVRSSEIRARKKEGELSAADLALLQSQTAIANLETANKEAEEKRAKKAAKDASKEGGWVKGEKYDVESQAYKDLSPEAQKYVTKKNLKLQRKTDKKAGEAKTESHFDVMNAIGGFLSGGGGKEGLGAAFQAGFSKKSPNEILAMQEAREARKKGTKGTEKKTHPYAGKTAEEISKMKIAAKLKEATNLGTNGDNVGEIGDVIEIPDVG